MSEECHWYETEDLTAAQLGALVRTFFDEAADDPAVAADAQDEGVDLDALLAGGSDQIDVEPGDASLTGIEETILIKLATTVATKAWKKVIVPWLGRRHAKPLGRELPPPPVPPL